MRQTRWFWALLCAGMGLSLAAPIAAAQREPGFNLDRYAAPATPEDGMRLMLPDTLGHLRWSAALTLDYALKPLVVNPDVPTEADLVRHRLGAQLTAAVGVLRFLQAHVRLPMVLGQFGNDAALQDGRTAAAPGGFALSDLVLGASAELYGDERLGVGLTAELVTPTGNDAELAGDVGLEPWAWALLSYRVAFVTLATQLGGGWRPGRDLSNDRIGPELQARFGLYAAPLTPLTVSVELAASRGLRDRDAPGAADDFDALIGARYRFQRGLSLGGALGAGFSDAAGSPALRALFSIGVAAPRAAQQADADQDQDGDGVPDARDHCETEPEDQDEFEDQDGCPDLDNDADGVPDAEDRCPTQPEPASTSGERDGCPDADTDQDGIADAADKCASKPEDKDGFQDADGCPDPDNDADTVPDSEDGCPRAPGRAEARGCPQHVRLEGARVRFLQPVGMRPGKPRLRPDANAVLDELAALARANPDLGTLVIQVREADQAPRAPTLAQERADRVRAALLRRKVRAERVHAVGIPYEGGQTALVTAFFGDPANPPPALPPSPAPPTEADPKPAREAPPPAGSAAASGAAKPDAKPQADPGAAPPKPDPAGDSQPKGPGRSAPGRAPNERKL